MPRQVTRRVVEDPDTSVASSGRSTRTRVVVHPSEQDTSYTFDTVSTPVKSKSLASELSELNNNSIQVAHLEPVTCDDNDDDGEVESNQSSKENNINISPLNAKIQRPSITPGNRILADITSQSKPGNQSLELESAILGMENVNLDSFVDNDVPTTTPGTPLPAPKERLVIARLVLNNFKSYAGRQEIGPFHSSFSAIVGPNGSGKSNVIDSLLFVFGFRASKMRHGKLSALIHNSAAHPNLNNCSVEVHFEDVADNEDGSSSVVPSSGLVVSRRAFRNNSSKYYINSKESSFQEVTSLLKGRGIDLDHKRFLILQGEVESIAQMKPKAENDSDDGLLEYLEDIIGTSSYKKVIEESDAKVETLNEECTEKSSRLKLVEKEMGALEDQRDEILKFLKTENDIALKKSTLYQAHTYFCQQKMALSQKLVEEESAKLDEEVKKVSVNTDEIETLKRDVHSKSQESDKLKSTAQKLSKDLSKKEIEKVQTQEKKKHIDTKRKKLNKQIETAQFGKNEAESWLNNSQQETDNLNAQLGTLEENLQVEMKNYEKIQEELKDKTKVFADKIEETQQKLGPWREKITVQESELAVAKSEADIVKEKSNLANQALQDAREKVEDIIKQGRAKEHELGQLKKELHHVSSQIQLGVGECEDASQKLAKMKLKLIALRQNVDSARESLLSFSSQNKVLASLTQLNNSGRIQGFHGRLGGLGTIEQKFDIAISTACPSLENFVVDTVEAGQECVNYLRKNNLGRGKFILLDQLPKKNMSPIQTPENVPRLFDLVQPTDAKFAPAFYSVLGDTLVAEDVEQARRIAYGKRRFRVVTLEGVLVDTSGTMSGGGSVLRGGMKSMATAAISEQDVLKMEEERNKYESTFEVAESTLLMMESSLKELQDRKPKLELDISKVKMDIENLASEMSESQAQYKEIQVEIKSSRPDTGALEAAEAKVTEKEAELTELKVHSKVLEDEIAVLQENILDAGGVGLRMQRAKVDGIREQMDLLNTRISNGVMEKTKMQNELRKHEKAIGNAQKEIDAGEQDAEKFAQLLEEQVLAVESIEKEVNNANEVFDEVQEVLEELRKTLSIKQKEIDELRSTEIELRNTIDQHEKIIAEEARARDHWLELTSQLTLHDLNTLAGKSKSTRAPPVSAVKVEKAEEVDVEVEDNEEITPEANGTATVKEEKKDLSSEATFASYSEDELQAINVEALKKSIENLEQGNENIRLDMQVLKDYQRRLAEFEERRDILNDAIGTRDKLKNVADGFRQKRLDEFMTGFNAISSKLKEMYQMITMGGNAELELVDSLDPFAEGILFSVMPPKKSWRNISNLSGGEKTLSSLALVFALHHYKPTPLYVMDEIDAALDFRNVSIVATYIKERTKNGQFIVISLRNNMFELAQQLVGIYKVNNMTRSIALENKDYIKR